MSSDSALTVYLSRAPRSLFSAYALVAAFGTYFAMYGFRKAFAAATYAEPVPWLLGIDEKTLYIVAQVIGYALSKFAGIKVVSELTPGRRAGAIVLCIGVALAALVGFAFAPRALRPVLMLVNGLPLGLVWGLVFGFLEGRRVSDVLGVGLCVSFIVASGFVKSVGRMVLGAGVSEFWMPAATGALFLLPFLGFVAMLKALPPPTPDDEASRVRRVPMDASMRRAFFRRFSGGLFTLVLLYVVLTAYRDFRDNFARELWDALGYGAAPDLLATTELPVALGALLSILLVMTIRDNRRAFLALHGVIFAGAALIAGSTLLFQLGLVGPISWMVSVGLGLYLGYVPFNCVLFDRLVAASGSMATAGFLIYVCDAWGYLGSVLLLLGRSFSKASLDWVPFFSGFSHATAGICALLSVLSAMYFARAFPASKRADSPTEAR